MSGGGPKSGARKIRVSKITFDFSEVLTLTKNPEINEHRRQRRKNDPEHRERLNEYGRKYRAENADKLREYTRERTRQYRADNPHLTFLSTSRYQAKKAGAYSDLTPEDALDIYNTPNICAYCGKDCGDNPAKRAIHIDHIIPMVQGGHNSRWNLTKACISCNSSKGSASLLDFYSRCDEFNEDRYAEAVAKMSALSGKSVEVIEELLAQSHAFERAYQEQRDKLVALLGA